MVFIKKHFVITCTLHVSTGIIHYYAQITGFAKSPVWLSGMRKILQSSKKLWVRAWPSNLHEER